ncbi:MAG: hypothetical protein B9J98_07665 [Candidatus Terraquivivens tikiterensis]|uniref:SpoVT-AbrB domain-containing protein n=1 Tax=Candidatus Terraquivivens tikiterensis TaxID=1980982 RepID=A0A2R7Y0N8_9ARCH|nr:MAG: hypothetical protein B9J98_07665 [Candidatus Terraquivivens tikiterensis]
MLLAYGSYRAVLEEAGVIPKSIRERLDLKDGDKLSVFTSGELIILRSVGKEGALSLMSRFIGQRIARLRVEQAKAEKAIPWARKIVGED